DKILQSKKVIEKSNSINFLGYKIGSLKSTFDSTGTSTGTSSLKTTYELCVHLSDNKIDKYLKKIQLSFKYFDKKKNHNRKYAFKLLCARIGYLTSNTKLKNNKDKVFVGIYFSNPFLNSHTSLEKLQKRLKWYISRAKLSAVEKTIIENYSFILGFTNRSFHFLPLKNKKYKSHNRKKNDVPNRNNKGILQFGLAEINSIWK
ncbi:hypothetical protein GVN16_25605, partial [Emticicia sp. CRIBPO]|uniref:hypothetical protein n=1 Tax=Emticicia sp. CRIBPO TaxID=2683258 RepID=UPI00197B0046